MTGQAALYDEDILLWSEQQAEVIRRLGQARRDLPNEFDVENVAEEIESVGRSELASVESQVQNVLTHLLKLALEPNSPSVRHWTVELVAFHHHARRRYSPSMRQRIDVDDLWRLTRELTVLGSEAPEEVEALLPLPCPVGFDDLMTADLKLTALVSRIQSSFAPVAS